MQYVLQALNGNPGVLGSLVIAPDGLPIVAELSSKHDQETVAALSAHLAKQIQDWLYSATHGPLTLAIIEAQEGHLLITALTWGYLVALARKDANLGLLRLSLKRAALQLDELCAVYLPALEHSIRDRDSSEAPVERMHHASIP